jgi:hypothetical protein
MRHLIDCFVHGSDGCRWQRLGNIANAATNQPVCGFGIFVAERLYSPANLGKQIAGF